MTRKQAGSALANDFHDIANEHIGRKFVMGRGDRSVRFEVGRSGEVTDRGNDGPANDKVADEFHSGFSVEALYSFDEVLSHEETQNPIPTTPQQTCSSK
jgi:hypothetical protein